MKELVIFDLDGTIIYDQSQELFLQYLLSEKLIGRVFYTKLILWFLLYKLGLVQEPKRAMEFAFSFLIGRTTEDVASMVDDFFETILRNHIYTDAIEVIEEHKREGKEIVIISNAIEPIVKEVSKYLGISHYVCTKLEVIDNCYTGRILEIVYGKNKINALERFVQGKDFDLKKAWAYGDHPSDQHVLSLVGHPVAINPLSILSDIAKERKWETHLWNNS